MHHSQLSLLRRSGTEPDHSMSVHHLYSAPASSAQVEPRTQTSVADALVASSLVQVPHITLAIHFTISSNFTREVKARPMGNSK